MYDPQKLENCFRNLDQYIRTAGDITGVTAKSKQFIETHLEKILTSEMDVLDVGAGDCVTSDLLKGRVRSWIGINKGGDFTTSTAQGYNVQQMDMHFLDFADNSFDLVIAVNVLEHAYCPILALFEWARVCRHYCYIQLPVPAALGGIPAYEEIPDHFYIQSPLMWEKLFTKAGFFIVKKSQDGGEYQWLLTIK
jgi:SAM-dependent methyltransferase